jgi:drug/metabolite transporter (DMT)-like permease
MTKAHEKTELGALVALFAGALFTGGAGILVRLAETGPTATAFWRGGLALPLLALWALFEPSAPASATVASPELATRKWRANRLPDLRRAASGTEQPAKTLFCSARAGGGSGVDVRKSAGPPQAAGDFFLLSRAAAIFSSFRDTGFLWAGVFFAGDLVLYNWSLLLTSVAAATLESSLAPLVATFLVWALWRERPTARFLAAAGFASLGVLLIVSPKFGHGGSAFIGDALGLGTAVFFAGYILAVARLRATYGAGVVMFNSTLVFTVLLLPLGLSQKFVPDTLSGWAAVAGIAVAAQVLGQGLIAYALAHLRPTFSSLGLLVQTLGAAASAWWVLGERLGPIQILGALVMVGGIALARAARKPAATTGSASAQASTGSLGVVRD